MKRRSARLPSRRCPCGLVAIVCAVALFLEGGCSSQWVNYEQIRASRADAYQQWRWAHDRGGKSKALVRGGLSLEDALKLALTYSKPLQVVVEQKAVARGRILESYGEALPTLSAVGNYTRLDEVSSFDVGGESISLGYLDNYSVELQVRQPVFRGGSIPAALRAARLFSSLTDEQIREAVQNTIYAVARDYYRVLLAQRLYEVNEEAVRSAKEHLAEVEEKRTRGTASDFDVLRAQVDLSNFQAEMIQQQNLINVARAQLLKSMGVSQDSDVTLSDNLRCEPARPVWEEAVRIAYENRPDLYQAELGIRLQQEAVRVARSRYWPRVDVVFAEKWARPDPHSSTDDEWGDAWTAGLTVEWPLFDGFRRKGRVIQEEAALRQKKSELADAEERALLQVKQAMLSLRDAEEFVESQKLNLERAREGLRLAEVGYRQGIRTEVEIVDARLALTRASSLYYKALYDHTVARLDLQRAMGILGPRAGESHTGAEPVARPGDIGEFSLPSQPGTADRPDSSAPLSAEAKGEH